MKPFREFLDGLENSPLEIQAVVGAFMSAVIFGLCWVVALLLRNLATGRDAVVVCSIIAISCMVAASALSISVGIIAWAKGRAGVGFGMVFSPVFLFILLGPHC